MPQGHVHIQASFNNTIVTITDLSGAVVAWGSAGTAGFKGSRKSTPYAAALAADGAAAVHVGLVLVDDAVATGRGPASLRVGAAHAHSAQAIVRAIAAQVGAAARAGRFPPRRQARRNPCRKRRPRCGRPASARCRLAAKPPCETAASRASGGRSPPGTPRPAARSARRSSRRSCARSAASRDGSAITASSASNRTHWSASFSTLRWAVSATTRNRSGCRASTSSVFSPIEPVEPRMQTRSRLTAPALQTPARRKARRPAGCRIGPARRRGPETGGRRRRRPPCACAG
mgnify:CR=1 FL=1